MGNNISTKSQDKNLNTSVESTEIVKLDPRSPTADISRTPVQLHSPKKCSPKITKQQNLNETLSTPTKVQTKGMLNSLLRVRLGANIDLRSPSANIDRTPIVLGKNVESDSKIVLEEVTDNVSYLSLGPEMCEEIKDKRQSYLETDLDTMETVPKLKKSVLNTPHLKNDLFDPRSPSSEFCRTPILQNDNTEFLSPIPDSTLTIVNEIDGSKDVTDDKFLDCLPSDKSLSPDIIKSTKLDEIKKDFAKKYGKNIKSNPVNQVYEDKECYKVTPRKALSASGRTPLSCVRNKTTHLRSKSDNTQENKHKSNLNDVMSVAGRTPLKCLPNADERSNKKHLTTINDLTSNKKAPKSKIPMLKAKAVNAVADADWDKDSSVVI